MKAAKQTETSMPDELRDHLDEMVVEYKRIRVKEDHVRRRLEARTIAMRLAMGELYDKYYERLGRLQKKRDGITAEFLDIWSKRLSGVRRVVLPSAVVCKRRDTKVTVHNKQEVIDALDRLDRLDLVDESIDEKGLRALAREGKLKGLPKGAVEVNVELKIQVRRRKDT